MSVLSVRYNVPEPHLGHERAVAFVSFTARRAVTRAGEYYEAHLQLPCHGDSQACDSPLWGGGNRVAEPVACRVSFRDRFASRPEVAFLAL